MNAAEKGRLAGRVAIVTGGAAGIGLATAQLIAAEGGAVAIGDIDETSARGAAAAIAGGRAWGGKVDVSDEASVSAFVAEAAERLGAPTALVNNAGLIASTTSVLDCTLADWDHTFAVNVRGTFLISRAVLPLMTGAGGGAIVNLGSAAALAARRNLAAYSASKGAILALTRAMAADFGGHNVRVNAVCPGPTMTAAFQRYVAGAPDPAAVVKARAAEQLLGRLGDPDDIANAIVFLLSDHAGWITGGTFPVDGGNTAA